MVCGATVLLDFLLALGQAESSKEAAISGRASTAFHWRVLKSGRVSGGDESLTSWTQEPALLTL